MDEHRTFNFAQAVAYAGVSRHRLHRAIAAGELASLGGGKPGTLLEIRERDLVRWCHQAKVILPASRKRKRPVRLEDMERRYEDMLERFQELIDILGSVAATMNQTLQRMGMLDGMLGEKLRLIITDVRRENGGAPIPLPPEAFGGHQVSYQNIRLTHEARPERPIAPE
jgi:hypothetical protein